MAENQEIAIAFTAQTTAVLAAGTLSQNRVQAVGTRTVGGSMQTFTATDFAYVATGNVQITKTSNAAAHPLYPGDRFTYTVAVTNPAGGTTLTGVSLFDALPAGVTAVAGTTSLSRSSVADDFTTAVYTNNLGTRNWAAGWVDSQGDGATAGSIQITGGRLRLTTAQNIYRQVNLTGVANATLALTYTTSGTLEDADVAYFEVATSAAGPWTTAFSFINDRTGTLTYAIPAGLLSATTIVRVRTTGYNRAGEYLYVDDLSVSYDVAVTVGNPPELLSGSAGYALLPGQSLTATFDVTVDDPLPSGLTSLTNTASTTSAQFPIAISDSVTEHRREPERAERQRGRQGVAGRRWGWQPGHRRAGDRQRRGHAQGPVRRARRHHDHRRERPLSLLRREGRERLLRRGDAEHAAERSSRVLPRAVHQQPDDDLHALDGQSYTDADVGYKPSATTATFGDLVWVDANNNGVRDAGEIGIGGVTVRLYQDSHSNGVVDVRRARRRHDDRSRRQLSLHGRDGLGHRGLHRLRRRDPGAVRRVHGHHPHDPQLPGCLWRRRLSKRRLRLPGQRRDHLLPPGSSLARCRRGWASSTQGRPASAGSRWSC